MPRVFRLVFVRIREMLPPRFFCLLPFHAHAVFFAFPAPEEATSTYRHLPVTLE